MSCYLDELRKRLVDKNERNEESKNLLGKRRDVAHEKAPFWSHNHQDDGDEPETDPHSSRQVLEVIGLTELRGKTF